MRLLLSLTAAALLSAGCQKERKVSTEPASTASGGAQQGGGGSSVFNRVSREKSLLTLGQLYRAYLATIATNGKPPRDADELKAGDETIAKLMKSPRDGTPFEIAYGVDPATVYTTPSETLLAWEATADSDGKRCALTVSGIPVYLSEEEFKKKTKPKKN